MINISICQDLDRINLLLERDDIGLLMGQYTNRPFIPGPNDGYYLLIQQDDEDVGIWLVEPMMTHMHFTIHMAFVKTFRGSLVYAASLLFIDFMKQLLPFATLWAFPPMDRPHCVKVAERAGFIFRAVVPNAIAVGDLDNNNITFVDQAVLTLTWNNK